MNFIESLSRPPFLISIGSFLYDCTSRLKSKLDKFKQSDIDTLYLPGKNKSFRICSDLGLNLKPTVLLCD